MLKWLQAFLFYTWVFVKNFFVGVVVFFILIIKLTWLIVKLAFTRLASLGNRRA